MSEKRDSVLLDRVDHLVYSTRDLEHTVAELERRIGCRASPGGRHPGRGTRNAIIPLGARCYLEIVGPDPSQPPPTQARWFSVDSLKQPRLVTWAANAARLEESVNQARQRGVPLGPVMTGSRRRPDGVTLQWRFTDPTTVIADGLVPFLIDWGDNPHPAEDGTSRCRLVDLRAEHPAPEMISPMLAALGVDLPVERGRAPALIATISGPNGQVELR